MPSDNNLFPLVLDRKALKGYAFSLYIGDIILDISRGKYI